MSFMNRAREAAAAAAEGAREAAELARTKASEATGAATRSAQDPATKEKFGRQAREAMGMARRGVSTVVERIDPGTLAEVIIKATALQEMTNASLRAKKSAYRISEVSISASIPPGVTFAISRVDEQEEAAAGGEVSSADLVDAMADSGEAVIALDGTTLDQGQIAEVRHALADEATEDLKLD